MPQSRENGSVSPDSHDSTHPRPAGAKTIYRALARTAAHPSADDVFAAVRKEIPSISLATVYKNLTTFRRWRRI